MMNFKCESVLIPALVILQLIIQNILSPDATTFILSIYMLHVAESGAIQFTNQAMSSTSISVWWSPPTDPNGVIKSYRIRYWRSKYLACDGGTGQTSYLHTSQTHKTMNNLNSFSRYGIVVTPANGFGYGYEKTTHLNTFPSCKYTLNVLNIQTRVCYFLIKNLFQTICVLST